MVNFTSCLVLFKNVYVVYMRMIDAGSHELENGRPAKTKREMPSTIRADSLFLFEYEQYTFWLDILKPCLFKLGVKLLREWQYM